MPRQLAPALIVSCALLSLWASSADSLANDIRIPLPNVEMTLSPRVTPKRLSRVEATPIALNINGGIKTLDGSQPPAVQEFVLDLDKHIGIDARGIPVCAGDGRDLRFPDLKSRCKDAIVGNGRVGIQFQFPEQPPLSGESELLVFNGGSRDAGTATLYAVAYLTEPITTEVVMTVEITRRPQGNRVVVAVPELVNGMGSLSYLNVTLKRRYTRNGKAVDFLTGSCPSGKLQSNVAGLFADGTKVRETTLQTCVPSS